MCYVLELFKTLNNCFPLLQWNSTETCDFVRDKLNEWDLTELIQRFEGKILSYNFAFFHMLYIS